MPLGRRDAAHLLRRAGFGARLSEIDELAALGSRAAAVNAMLDRPVSGGAPGPIDVDTVEGLQRWWLEAMRTGSNQVAEKLAYFWHGHFCSSVGEVQRPYMADQITLFRQRGFGSFVDLAQAVAIQPAMLFYLDNASNQIRKDNAGNVTGVAQENFGRELLELFLLGVVNAQGQPNYTEADIQASARAWTGHNLRPADVFIDGVAAIDGLYRYKFYPDRHDDRDKTFLGVTKNWNGPDIIDHVCTVQPWRGIVARHIARKLFAFYAYPDPDEATLAPIVSAFAARLQIRDLVSAILTSEAFWSDRARTGLLRPPVDYTVAALRAMDLQAHVGSPDAVMPATGQALLYPPNVSGWKQNSYWIAASAIQARGELAARVVRMRLVADGQGPFLTSVPSADPATAVRTTFETFGIVDEPYPAARRAIEEWFRVEVTKNTPTVTLMIGLGALVMLSPDYQMA